MNTTVCITVAPHPAGILLQGFTCIASHPGQWAIEYAYWCVDRLGYYVSILIDPFDRYANLAIDTYCVDQDVQRNWYNRVFILLKIGV